MASSSHEQAHLAEVYANMSIADKDEEGLVVDEDVVEETEVDLWYCLVGRFLTEGSIHFDSIRIMMASLWKLVKGVSIKELDGNLFMFQFFHERDIYRVIDDGLWKFNQHPLLIQRLLAGD